MFIYISQEKLFQKIMSYCWSRNCQAVFRGAMAGECFWLWRWAAIFESKGISTIKWLL